MFKKFTNGCVKLVQKYLPDPLIFCLALTFLLFVIGIVLTGQSPMNMVVSWGSGFWSLLGFSMQMAMVLTFGHAMANAPAFKKLLTKLASIPKTPGQAIVMVTVVAGIACWINWGFGLVIGAILARETARQVKGVDYRLLVASAYSGFLLWHQGISASIPLAIATASDALTALTQGAIVEAVPTSQTVFHPVILLTTLSLLIILPLVNRAMHPDPENTISFTPPAIEPVPEMSKADMTPADKAERGPFFTALTVCMGGAYIAHYFLTHGFLLNLDIVIFSFLIIGMTLHKTPRSYLDAISEGVKGTSGILLQFPFYAGIAAMMVSVGPEGQSVANMFSTGIVSIANDFTFPLLSFISAGIVNIFIPSGGGQWSIQAPIIMPAAMDFGVHPAVAAMSIAFGDVWTSMIQPFWALPALGIAGLTAKDIMGYCVVHLIVSGIVFGISITIFGMVM